MKDFFTSVGSSLLPPKSPDAAIHDYLEHCPSCHRWALNNSCFLRELRESNVPHPLPNMYHPLQALQHLDVFLLTSGYSHDTEAKILPSPPPLQK